MIRLCLILVFCLPAPSLWADAIIAARAIRANTVIQASDILISRDDVPGAITDPGLVIGQEARVTIYPGRALFAGDIATPAIVDRNQVVEMRYRSGPLLITTEGRMLARGRVGERVRVMNLASRTTVWGTVTPSGVIEVNP